MSFIWTTISLIIIIFVNISNGYSNGGPERACLHLIPGHGVDKQFGKSPFLIKVEPIIDSNNNSVLVSIESKEKNKPFTGFMIQSRNYENKNQIIDGIFEKFDEKLMQTKNCNSDKANTLTHTNGSKKHKIQTVWTLTNGQTFRQQFIFRATIVQTKQIFWTEQDSFPVSLPVISNNNNLEKPFLKVNEKSLERSEKSLNYSICSEKFCLGLSSDSNDNCVEKKTCEVLISGKFLDKKKGLTQFEINALVNANTNTKKWFSMGLSEDKKMGSDLVKDCLLLSDGTVKQTLSFNSENEKENELIDNNNYLNDIKEDETNYFDGILTCKWTLNAKILIKGKQFDLLLNKYFILLAFGDLEDDHGKKVYHDSKLYSDSQIDFEQKGIIRTVDPLYLVRIHGSLMAMVWIGFVSIAILLARHYKQVWVSSTLCGVKLWFAFHRGLMLTGLILMFLAQTCIFYYLGEYRFGWHQLFGSLAFAIAILQPIGALFRPHPEASNRWIFNWFHWFCGNFGHITAIIAIFLATNLKLADLPNTPFLWTIISFVIFHVFIHFVLQFHPFFMQKRKRREIALQDINSSLRDEPEMIEMSDAPGSGFRRFILGIYVMIVSAFVITIICLISLPKSTLKKMAIN